MEREIKNIVDRILSEEIKKSSSRIKNRINENAGMCSECGGKMYEGECMECGSMYEGEIQELGGMDDGHPRFGKKRFKSPMSIEDIEKLLRGDENEDDMDLGKFEPLDDIDMDLDKLKPRRDRDMGIDFEEIDEDDCMECGDMYEDEVEEGNEFSGELAKAREEGRKSFTVDGKTYPVKETYYRIDGQHNTLFTENEMIDIIEKIINENQKYEKGKVSTSNVLKSSLNKSGKEESDYIDMVTKKMKEYLKTGSKGKYEMNPKHFPKGNGELEEMEKMAFSLTDDNEDFNYQIAGLNIPVPDAIEFNDERMDKYYEGSSETGNAPGGNALESDANSRFNKFRKNQTLDKLKKQSYNKSPQPVFNEKSGQEKGEGIKIKLESTEDKKVLSEITKMKNLIGYNQKTQ